MIARNNERDPMIAALSRLQAHEPDPARAARVRARGRAALETSASRWRAAGRRAPRTGWRAVLEPLLVAGACAVFLFEVFSRATHLYRF